ncbi:enoyl-CoA hydratase-related protein [Paracoccus sp. DMF]|uniref:enoyl-CoA hydratase-related protein n=1 Tax=Paracoccus sp. DMF TaxID=400837 RepID=UPI0021E4B2A8|nr:enoyl-CoA hydratase-related protein [Paracoccus sp. DMF]MCV2448145.1 enoyl-CoA hydratase-related protein [Paracoccus sp. DMF]
MSDSELLTEISAEGWAILRLNRPERLNTLSVSLRRALIAEVARLEADPAVRVLILTGSGRAFSAGLEVSEWDSAGAAAAGAWVHDPVAALRGFSGPVIGAINGLCVTGGLELALACDLLVAARGSRFADTHSRVGLLPGWGGSVRLARRIGPARAMEMALTARFLSDQEALDWGLVNHLVPADALLPTALDLARQSLAGPKGGTEAYKALLQQGSALPFEEALALERATAIAVNSEVTAAEIQARIAALRGRG